jgi:hypothetical protein
MTTVSCLSLCLAIRLIACNTTPRAAAKQIHTRPPYVPALIRRVTGEERKQKIKEK